MHPLVQDSVQGTSLAAAFDDPLNLPPALETKRAYSQIGRCACGAYCPGGKPNSISGPYLPCKNDTKSTSLAAATELLRGPARAQECGANACCQIELVDFDYMGYTVRTATRRFTAWVPMDNKTLRADWTKTVRAQPLFACNSTTQGRMSLTCFRLGGNSLVASWS